LFGFEWLLWSVHSVKRRHRLASGRSDVLCALLFTWFFFYFDTSKSKGRRRPAQGSLKVKYAFVTFFSPEFYASLQKQALS